MTAPLVQSPTKTQSSGAAPVERTADFHPARQASDPSRLAPEHAFYSSPTRRRWERSVDSLHGSVGGDGDRASSRSAAAVRRRRDKPSRSRGSKGIWKKLLWVKQSYPDNYTDPPTFLSHLQRNPRLQPYDFWPLVADSTVIVQHVCSVAIFVCCFVGIYHEQLSPIAVVSWGSAGTVLGWVCFDAWIGAQQQPKAAPVHHESGHSAQESSGHSPQDISGSQQGIANSVHTSTDEPRADDGISVASTLNSSVSASAHGPGLGLTLSSMSSAVATRPHSRELSTTSLSALSPMVSPTTTTYMGSSLHGGRHTQMAINLPPPGGLHLAGSSISHSIYSLPYDAPAPLLSARNQQRISTAKSAILIYAALLGLSPILKSLTQSTTSDSIWAMSTWLMCINVFFFDYGGEVGTKFPASLSTNAALMASTVLASRLTSTTHVFSLTLFSIEVFGLFPVFRRHLRVKSWVLHVLLTVLLIVGAGAALGITLIGGSLWVSGIVGAVVWGLANIFAMGGCSWWLIGLQRYKNVVIGPWDPARPVIRAGGWE